MYFRRTDFPRQVVLLFGPTLSNSAQQQTRWRKRQGWFVFGTSNTATGSLQLAIMSLEFSHEADIARNAQVAAQKTVSKNRGALRNDDISPRAATTTLKKLLQDLKIA
jgi:branched-chain amino acid transport system substrate-binding protein